MNRCKITALINAMREKYMMLRVQEIGEIEPHPGVQGGFS